MKSRAINSILFLALALAPSFVRAAEAPYSERGPRDLKGYLAEGRDPQYLRVNVRGYNIRTSANFSTAKTDNLDFKTKGSDLFKVQGVRHLSYGASVQIDVNGGSRWIYVPYGRKDDFQFCESEACFTAMADSLEFFVKGSGVTIDQARACGASAGPEGLILPAGAEPPHREPIEPAIAHAPRPQAPRPHAPMSGRMLWEDARGAQGENWTRMLSESMDRHGQRLISQRTLKDAETFCPNYSNLDEGQRKEFWMHLLNGVARYESNFKLYEPAFNEATHRDVFHGPVNPQTFSMGLFQLSYSAAPGYRPGCKIDWSVDRGKDVTDRSLTIYNPKIQMDCAVTIMNKLVGQDGAVGLRDTRGGARFWSTLRSSNPATKNVIQSMHRYRACWR